MFLLIQQPVFGLRINISYQIYSSYFCVSLVFLRLFDERFYWAVFFSTGATAPKERSRINDNLLVMRALIKAYLKLIENYIKKK